MDYGAWEGRTYEQIDELDGAYRRAWEQAPDRLACPGGESGDAVAERVRTFLRDLLDEHRAWHARASLRHATSGRGAAAPRLERPILVVAHATTNRILVCLALGIEIREFRRRLTQSPANLTVLRWDLEAAPDEARLLVLNDTAHLRRADETPWA